MADHRRVEARSIIGTGMANDVDRLRDIEADQQRMQRGWRVPAEKGFGEVLAEAPPKGELEDDSPEDPRKRKRAPDAPSPAAMASAAASAVVSAERSESAAAVVRGSLPAKAELPKVAPDPRERMLREKLANNLAKPKGSAPADTPPTGSHLRKP